MSNQGPWDYVYDFFRRLVKSRIDAVEIKARSKVKNVEYKAKSVASSKFNNAVDGAVNKAKDTAKPKAAGPPEKKKKDDDGGES